jgi:hypothetical protein
MTSRLREMHSPRVWAALGVGLADASGLALGDSSLLPDMLMTTAVIAKAVTPTATHAQVFTLFPQKKSEDSSWPRGLPAQERER